MRHTPSPKHPGGWPPSVRLAVAAWVAYTAVTVAVQASSGIPYAAWFATAHSTWRVGVLSLALGSGVLVAFVAGTRWTHLWTEPRRLPVTRLMRAALAVFMATTAMRLAGTDWSRVPPDLLLAVLAVGVLVGFAEELLFRGLVLRSLRDRGRPEWAAAAWTAAAFGLFHLPNVFMGTGLLGLAQLVLAGLTGVTLYLFRRATGRLWPAMLAHGLWDISVFLTGGYGAPWVLPAGLLAQALAIVLSLAVLWQMHRHDRHTVALPPA